MQAYDLLYKITQNLSLTPSEIKKKEHDLFSLCLSFTNPHQK
jgi:hypothetical protein